MYTQCPECSTVFQVSPADLAVAGGAVRCGECASTFNALLSLSETPLSRSGAPALPTLATQKPVQADDRSDDEQSQAAAEPGTDATADAAPANKATPPDADEGQSAADNQTPEDHAQAATDDTDSDTDSDADSDTANEDYADSDADDAAAGADRAANNDAAAGADTAAAIDEAADSDTGPGDEPPSAEARSEHRYDTDRTDPRDVAIGDNDEDEAPQRPEPEAEVAEHRAAPAENEADDDEQAPVSDTEPPAQSSEAGDTAAALCENLDDGDEIVLDDRYRPPIDDRVGYIEDEPDMARASSDEDMHGQRAPDSSDDHDGEPVTDTLHEVQADDSEPQDDTEAKEHAADQSVLFSLPVPQLHTAQSLSPALPPEKREGGEAAIDPSAQSGGSVDTQDTDTDSDIESPATAAARAITAALRDNDALDEHDARDLRAYLRAPPRGRIATLGWSAAITAAAIALIAQLVHANRGDLILHPRLGPVVRAAYERLQIDVQPNWRIRDYQVVGQARLIQIDTAGDEQSQPASGYRFVAIIANRADRAQPPPLVRLTLRDRWGDPTGMRDFTPPEYLSDRSMAEDLLEPGQRLRVVLNLSAPGTEVDGFEFDMCLPDHEGTLRCAKDPRVAPPEAS